MPSIQEVREMLSGGVERRTAPLEIESVEKRGDGGELRISGYAAVFESRSEPIWGMFTETIKRGAFRKALRSNPDVPLVFNHEGQPVARTTNGTLVLSEDARGLRIEADLAPTTLGRDLHALIERGDLSQMSFAFTVANDEWVYREGDDLDERTITEMGSLLDTSVVTTPAYRATEVTTERAAEANIDTPDSEGGVQEVREGDEQQHADSGTPAGSTPKEGDEHAGHAHRARTLQILSERLENV